MRGSQWYRHWSVLGLVWLGCMAILVGGCGGSGGSSGSPGGGPGTSIRIVFPPQQALLGNPAEPATTVAAENSRQIPFAKPLSYLTGVLEVRLAYAQAIPANVARLTLTVTGNGFSEADITSLQNIPIPLNTGQVTVDIPTGSARTFTVEGFLSTSATAPSYVGRTTVDIPNTGTSVTVTMARTHDPVVRSPGSQTNPGGSTVSLPLVAGDPDGDALTCSVTGLPPGLTFDPTACLISGTIAPAAEGVYTATATVSDGTHSSSTTFTWTVTPSPPPPPLPGLTVNVAGSGRVTSNPLGISCPTDCAEAYAVGTQVILTATPAQGFTFTDWNLDSCPGKGSCTLTLAANTTVTATFELIPIQPVNLTLEVAGSGMVTSQPTGISCPGDCSEPYIPGTLVTLTPMPAQGWRFVCWSLESCPGTEPCTLPMTTPTTVIATFVPIILPLRPLILVNQAGSGSGTVTSEPTGITCPADCEEPYPFNTQVTLTAAPALGSTFTGWDGGGCTGTAPCTLTLQSNTTVTSNFELLPPPTATLTVVATNARVTSEPSGIDCSSEATTICTVGYPVGTLVMLTGSPIGGDFVDFSGGCTGRASCTVTMEGDTTVTASGIIGILNSARFAYVVNRGDDTISIYAVDATTGQLRHNGYMVVGSGPTSLTVDRFGRFAYVANSNSHDLSAYRIEAKSGALIPLQGSPFPTGKTPVAVTLDPSGRFAYVANADSHDISAYRVDAKIGSLTPVPGAPYPTGERPSGITVDRFGRFVYVTNAGSHSISAYSINAKIGVLRPVQGSPFPTGITPVAATLDPSGRFVYVANADSHEVSAYRIDPKTGGLTSVPGAPFPAGDAPRFVTVDRSGQFAYVANADSHDISGYRVDATTGALTHVPGSPFPAGTTPVSVSLDPSGRFAYVANADFHEVSVYTIDRETGVLSPVGTVRTRDKVESIVVSAGTKPLSFTPKFLYVTLQSASDSSEDAVRVSTDGLRHPPRSLLPVGNSDRPLREALFNPPSKGANAEGTDIAGYLLNARTGGLTPLPTSLFPVGEGHSALAVEPSGRFIYVVDAESHGISAYRIDATTGALRSLPGGPFAEGGKPTAFAMEPSGRFVYVMNADSRDIAAYAIEPTSGSLTPLVGGALPVGDGPHAIAVDPAGRFLYVVNSGSRDVAAYAIDPRSGMLAAVPGPPVPTGERPVGVTIEPSGRFVYTIDGQSHDVWAYAIEPTTGALIPVSGSPFPTGEIPEAIAAEPSGRFLYVANSGSHDLWGYAIESLTGRLTPLSGFPLHLGEKPHIVAVEPSGRFLYIVNNGSRDVTAYAIEPTSGSLTPLPGFPLPVEGRPDSLAIIGILQ